MNDKLDISRRNRELLKGELEAAGTTFTTGGSIRCPFHDDHKPSGGIYQRDGIWRFKCQACGVSGDVFDIRAKRTNRPLAEVLLEAIRETQGENRPAGKRSNGYQAGTGQDRIFKDLDALRAALPGQIILEHHYDNPSTGQTELLVFRCETVEGKVYRPAHPVKGGFVIGASAKPWPLYNRGGIRDNDTLLVCEGEKCCDILIAYGIAAATNAFGAGKAEHADWAPLTGKNVVLWPDNDTAGQNHMRQVATILETLDPKPRISWLSPENLDLSEKEDVADLVTQLRTLGKTEAEITTELHKIIATARPLGPLEKLHKRIRAITRGEYRCISWPWPLLTTLTKALLPGSIALIAGTVGASKSFMLLQCILWWLAEGERTAYFCLEGDRAFHLCRAMAQLGGLAGWTDPEWLNENMLIAEGSLQKHKEVLEAFSSVLFTGDNLGAETLEQLAEWVERQARLGRRIIAIDPITAATRTSKPWVADLVFLKSVKKIIAEHGCSLVLVTHPQKGVLEPDLSNLAGSAAYERFVEVIITLHRHEDQKTNQIATPVGRSDMLHTHIIRIEKARNGRGAGLRLAYQFQAESLTLTEVGLIVKDGTQSYE